MWNSPNAPRHLLGALVLGGVLTSAVGCVDNTVSVYIRQVQAPTLAGVVCTVSSDPTSQIVSEGILDVALRNDYTLAPLLANQLLTRASMEQQRIESSTLNIQGFEIELHEGAPEGALVVAPFTVYQNVVVPASLAAGTPGYSFGRIQVIPPQVGDALSRVVCNVINTDVTPSCPVPQVTSSDRRILVKITAFGESLGQSAIEATPYYFPVRVCCGCLIDFPLDSDAPPAVGGVGQGPDCNNGMAVPGPGSCNLGQDFLADCRLCSTRNRLCQPRGFSPTGRTDCPR